MNFHARKYRKRFVCRQCKSKGPSRDIRRREYSNSSTKPRTDVGVQVIQACLEEEDLWTDTSAWACDWQDEDDSFSHKSLRDISKDFDTVPGIDCKESCRRGCSGDSEQMECNNPKRTPSAPVAQPSVDTIDDSISSLKNASPL
jgi:hypothetical protein